MSKEKGQNQDIEQEENRVENEETGKQAGEGGVTGPDNTGNSGRLEGGAKRPETVSKRLEAAADSPETVLSFPEAAADSPETVSGFPEAAADLPEQVPAPAPALASAPASAPASKRKKRKKKRKLGRIVVLLLLVAAGGAAAYGYYQKQSVPAAATAAAVRTAAVERRDITSELSSSGTIAPKDTYEITSLVEGEVIAADFEEGDQVTEGQVLYQIDPSTVETELNTAANSLSRAEESLQTAKADYQDVLNEYSGNTYKSTETGYIRNLYIKAGDKVGSNTKIADIYDDKTMKIRLPFLTGDAAAIAPGLEGVLTLTDTGEQLPGVVTAVSTMVETLTGGRIVRYVTLQVSNPGGLTTSMAATADVGGYSCSLEAYFEPLIDTVMSADLSGSVDVEALLVSEGDYIGKGTPVFRMDAKSAEKAIRSYKEVVDKASDTLESAQNKVDSTKDSFDNYTVTAPISGQVISKNIKAGDKITKSSSGATALAVIYDLSAYTFEMSVDELDVKEVEVGQKVEVTADAVSGKKFTGTVTNVSLQSSYSNGVTNYPVTVTLDGGTEELLPGMNVDGIIILSQAADVLTVPADALMRGNRVYVRDETVSEAQGTVPAGFRAVEVKTGLISEDYVEITEGLEEGDEVYVAESSVNTNGSQMMPGGGWGGGSGGGQPGGSQPGGSGAGGPGGGSRQGGGGAPR